MKTVANLSIVKALADYTANIGGGTTDPTVDKEQLVARIREVLGKTRNFLGAQGFDLQALVDAEGFRKTKLLLDACDAMCTSIETKKTFPTTASKLVRLAKYTDRDDLSKSEIKKIKEVSVSLLAKVKEKISQLDHWTDKQETKAVVDTLIRDTLWNELPDFYDDISISRYRQQIYEYVYTRYPDVA